jgi:hypothetical protein
MFSKGGADDDPGLDPALFRNVLAPRPLEGL